MKYLLSPAVLLARCALFVVGLGGLAAVVQAQEADFASLDSLLNLQINTAARYEQTTSEAPASVTVVTAEEIETLGYTSVAEVLTSLRSFYGTYDNMRTNMGVRGFGRLVDYNNRVLLLLNGQPLNERLNGTATLGDDLGLDLGSVERIEVVRGPGSVLYGTGAMFGVINVITRTPESFAGTQIRGQHQTDGGTRTSAAIGHSIGPRLYAFATGTLHHFGGSDLYFPEFAATSSNGGVSQRRNWRQGGSAFTRLLYGSWELQGLYRRNDRGAPNGDLGTLFDDPDAKFHTTNLRFSLKRTLAFGSQRALTVQTAYHHGGGGYQYPLLIDEPAFNLEQVRSIYELDFHQHSVQGEATYRWDLQANHRLVLGAEYAHVLALTMQGDIALGNGSITLPLVDVSAPYRLHSFFGQHQWQALPSLAFTVGLRRDVYSRGWAATSPRLAVVYHPTTRNTIKVLYGRAFRAANPLETDFFFELGSDQVRAQPNPALDPERVTTFEVVYEHLFANRSKGTLSIFSNQLSDLISPAPIDETGELQFSNIGQLTATGIEAEWAMPLREHARLLASYSYQFVETKGQETTPVNSPAHLGRLQLRTALGRWATLALSTGFDGERRTIQGEQLRAAIHSDVYLQTRPMLRHWRLSTRVTNLLDQRYYHPASEQYVQDRFLQPGRRVQVQLTFTY